MYRRRRRTCGSFHVVLQRTQRNVQRFITEVHAQPLFCSLNLLFGDVLVAVVVMVCLSSLFKISWKRFIKIEELKTHRLLKYVVNLAPQSAGFINATFTVTLSLHEKSLGFSVNISSTITQSRVSFKYFNREHWIMWESNASVHQSRPVWDVTVQLTGGG